MELKFSVYLANYKAGKITKKDLKKISPPGLFLHPMIDAKGEFVVYWGKAKGDDAWHIWRYDIKKNKNIRLTHAEGINQYPYISFDSRKIIFGSNRELSKVNQYSMFAQLKKNRCKMNLWMMDSSGGSIERITNGKTIDERPCFSPDRKHIFFNSLRNKYFNIYKMNLNTGRITPFTSGKEINFRMTLSANGKLYSYLTSSAPSGIRNVLIGNFINKKYEFPIKLSKGEWLHGPFFGYKQKYLYCHGSHKGQMYSIFKINLANHTIEKIQIPGIDIASHFTVTEDKAFAAFDSTQVIE